jgi:acyl-CoA synthetase (AMP-forming)/AMP-acid ligase II
MENRPWQRHYDSNVPCFEIDEFMGILANFKQITFFPAVPTMINAVINHPRAAEKEIIGFCREKLAAYKAPKIVEFRDDLPKSAVGKILRKVLQDEEATKKDN